MPNTLQHPANQALLERSLKSVWHPCTQMKQHEKLPLIPIVRGEGAWLFDAAGHRYLDAVSSWWVNLFGHCNAHINARLTEQMGRLEHVMLAGFTHEPVVRLSEKLAALTGHALGHAFFASDGASATEIALKMSLHFWRNSGRAQKNRFISLAGSYHGETVGALSVTDIALFRDAYAPLIRGSDTVPSPDARLAQAGETAHDVAERAAQALEAYLAAHHESLAAFILEPLVQCANSMTMYDAHYLRRARELCTRYQVHLIADEIAVGCGRTGQFFAWEHALPEEPDRSDWPDFICLSKGITGGYLPLSLVLSTDEVFDAFYDEDVTRGFLHSHSYTGNALACTAALATLELFEQTDVIAQNKLRAHWLGQAGALLREVSSIEHVRQQGMILAFDVANAPKDFSRRMHAAALAREVLLRPIGNTVYWMPPFVLDAESHAWLGARTREALQDVLGS